MNGSPLKTLVAQGLRNNQIAERLGVHPSTITRRLREEGLANPDQKLTERRASTRHLHALGWSVADIARFQAISVPTVYRDLRPLAESDIGPGQTDVPA